MEETLAPYAVEAGALWMELGWTSSTNPIHHAAFERLYAPFGIQAEYLLFEIPESRLEVGRVPTLLKPAFEIDRVSPALSKLFPPVQVRELYTWTVNAGGGLAFNVATSLSPVEIGLVDAFGTGKPLLDVLASAHRSCAKLIFDAWLKTASDRALESESRAFVHSPEEYADKVFSAG